MIDVYLVPVGADRYEPYCEIPDTLEEETDPSKVGFIRRMRHRFREMLAEAERERRQAHPVARPETRMGRLKARTMRLVAESIAEQRLLWHLRTETEACLHYPDDLDAVTASSIMRSSLKRDLEKHRFWLIIDSLLFVASGAFFFVPGPNLIAYYFAFRLVGHYLSMRGARQGLDAIRWHATARAPLSELRRAIGLAPDVRERRVHEVAALLRLEHLASFFERSAIPTQ